MPASWAHKGWHSLYIDHRTSLRMASQFGSSDMRKHRDWAVIGYGRTPTWDSTDAATLAETLRTAVREAHRKHWSRCTLK